MVHPVLAGGYVLDGGALCMELMTPQVIQGKYHITPHPAPAPPPSFFATKILALI